MASPAVGPPQTLPANFQGWDAPKAPPTTLPADFQGWDKPAEKRGPVGNFIHNAAAQILPSTQLNDYIPGGSAPNTNLWSQAGQIIKHPLDSLAQGAKQDWQAYTGGQQQELGRAKELIAQPGIMPKLSAATHAVNAMVPFIGPAVGHAQDQMAKGDYSGGLGTTAGVAAGLAGPKAAEIGGPALEATGQGMKDAGVGVINQTVGARKADFARGKSPGEGYFQAGLGPSASMRSIADKSQAAVEDTGNRIGDVYAQADSRGVKIPFETLHRAVNEPVMKTRSELLGPGGTGNPEAVDAYAKTFEPLLKDSIQNGGASPLDVFAAKRNAAKNTTWGDPTQAGMKELRQNTVGSLGDSLVNAIPESAPLNEKYANLLPLAARSAERADTHSMPLTRLAGRIALGGVGGGLGMAAHVPSGPLIGGLAAAALDSVPARTTAASALFHGGGIVKRAGIALPNSSIATPGLQYTLQAPLKKYKDDDPENQ